MSDKRYPNGAYVSRMWADDSSESLAVFQYHTDAERFARMKADDQDRPPSCRYIVFNSYNGDVKVYRAPDKAKASTCPAPVSSSALRSDTDEAQ